MKEFMLLVYNEIDHQANWTPERHRQFLRSCENYIGKLQKDGKLKIAEPLIREGNILSGSKGNWQVAPFNATKGVQVGCYHILAKDLDEATEMEKGNPEFEFSATARVEVRPIKTKEETTDYQYPSH